MQGNQGQLMVKKFQVISTGDAVTCTQALEKDKPLGAKMPQNGENHRRNPELRGAQRKMSQNPEGNKVNWAGGNGGSLGEGVL